MGKDTRTYSGHWNAYIEGREHPRPPSKWRWLKDAVIAGVAAFFLGYSLGIAIVKGFVPLMTFGIGALVLAVLVGVLGLGQRVDSTRYDRGDLVRIASVGLVAFFASTLIGVLASI